MLYKNQTSGLSHPVHFLFSSMNNCSCYSMRPRKLSHFLWSFPLALPQVHHCWMRDVTGRIASRSLSVYGPVFHKFVWSFLNPQMLSLSMVSCGSKFHKTDIRYSLIFHERDPWDCLSDFFFKKVLVPTPWSLQNNSFEICGAEVGVFFLALQLHIFVDFLLATGGTAWRQKHPRNLLSTFFHVMYP